MKKLNVLLVLLFFVVFSAINISATEIVTTDDVFVSGAMVRTNENSGIRFVGQTTYSGSISKYGIVLAFGEANVSNDFVINGTVNQKSVLNGSVSKVDEKGYFYVTLYNIPQNSYVQKVSARAYIETDDGILYSNTAITRSLFEVSLHILNNKDESAEAKTYATGIASFVDYNYRKVNTDRLGNLYIDSPIFETNHELIGLEFIKDYSAFSGERIDNYTAPRSTNYSLMKAICEGAYDPFSTDYDSYNFFNDTFYGAKWTWLLDFIEAYSSYNSAMSIQIAALKGENSSPGSDWFGGINTFGRVCGFFMQDSYDAGIAPFDFADVPEIYSLIAAANKTVYANPSNIELVKINSTYNLETKQTPTDEEFGWTDGTQFYVGNLTVLNKDYFLTSENRVKQYTVTLFDGDEIINTLSYTHNDEVITLPTYSREGYVFKYWVNSEGIQVDSIDPQTRTNYVLYAHSLEIIDKTVTYSAITDKVDNELALTKTNAIRVSQTENGDGGNRAYVGKVNAGVWYKQIYLQYDYYALAYKIIALSKGAPTYPVVNDYDLLIVAHDNANKDGNVYKESYLAIAAIADSDSNIGKYIVFSDSYQKDNGDINFYLFDTVTDIPFVKEIKVINYQKADGEIVKLWNPTSYFYREFVGWCTDEALSTTAILEESINDLSTHYYAKHQEPADLATYYINETKTSLEQFFEEGILNKSLDLGLFTNFVTLEISSSHPTIFNSSGVYNKPYKKTNVAIEINIVYQEMSHLCQFVLVSDSYKSLDGPIASSYLYQGYNLLTDEYFEIHDIANCAFAIANDYGLFPSTTSNNNFFSNITTYVTDRAYDYGVWKILSVAPESKWTSFANPDNELINQFANEIVRVINLYGFDGVDIDWEYPNRLNDDGTAKQTGDTTNQGPWFVELSRVVYEKVKANNPDHLVTTAIAGGMWQLTNYNLETSAQYYDYINLMCYDMSQNEGQYHNALYPRSGKHNTTFNVGSTLVSCSVNESITLFNNKGVPNSKLVVGVPFYGVKQELKEIIEAGKEPYNAYRKTGTIAYTNLISYFSNPNYIQAFDNVSKVPYLVSTDGSVFISYEDEASILIKCDYIIDKKLAGIMYWQSGNDTTSTYIRAIKVGLNK